MRKHKFEHTENLVKCHNGITYEVLPKGSLFKYRLLEDYFFDTGIKLRKSVSYELIELKTTGRMHLKTGYMWDGATWFPDIQPVMRASLEHDPPYLLFMLKLLDLKHRITINGRFKDVCIKDGMKKWLAKLVYRVLRVFGDDHIRKCINKNDTYGGMFCDKKTNDTRPSK